MTDNLSLAYRVSGFNRRRKWDLFLSEIWPQPGDRILDVGFSDKEYSTTDNFLEKNYAQPEMITALGVDEPIEFPKRYPQIKAIQYDGAAFPFDDGTFDICWSNAVLEHVGAGGRRRDWWDAQASWLREIARVARTAFVTTPNRWFPMETHTRTPFLHWLPKHWFDAYLHKRGQEWAADDYMQLLSLQDVRRVLGMAGIDRYRIVPNRLFGVALDFVVIFGDEYRP